MLLYVQLLYENGQYCLYTQYLYRELVGSSFWKSTDGIPRLLALMFFVSLVLLCTLLQLLEVSVLCIPGRYVHTPSIVRGKRSLYPW